MTQTLSRTRLYAQHQALSPQWTQFAQWEVPLQYQRVALEHAAVRQVAGLFDISHMGILYFAEASLLFLDSILPLVVTALPDGKAKYTLVLTETGTIVDDVMVYRIPPSQQFRPELPKGGAVVVANASNTTAVMDWFKHTLHLNHQPQQLTLDLLALQGPRFAETLDNAVQLPKRYSMASVKLYDDLPPLWVARTGYTGEDGLEIFCPDGSAVWQTVLSRLIPLGGLPCGFAARDTLRMEAALPLYGHELDTHTTPLNAGLGWAIKSEGPFVGRDALKQSINAKHLVHLQLPKPPVARQGHTIVLNDKPVGHITSGCLSPTLGVPIAMGYVDTLADGYHIEIRGQRVFAPVVSRPFYKNPYKKPA